VLGFVVAWAVWIDKHDGEAPTVYELAGANEKSRAQWYRDSKAFRECFEAEGYEMPDAIARRLLRMRVHRTPAGVFGASCRRLVVA
jgi:hypothetical protein